MDEMIGQQVAHSPSVFNFYLPNYQPPGPVEDAGLYAPEATLGNAPFMIGYLNGMAGLVEDGLTHCNEGFGSTQPQDDHLTASRSCSLVTATNDGFLEYEFAGDGEETLAGDIVSELSVLLTGGREPPLIRTMYESLRQPSAVQICADGFSLEDHAGQAGHGDVCRATSGSWAPPLGCEVYSGSPYAVFTGTAEPCRSNSAAANAARAALVESSAIKALMKLFGASIEFHATNENVLLPSARPVAPVVPSLSR